MYSYWSLLGGTEGNHDKTKVGILIEDSTDINVKCTDFSFQSHGYYQEGIYE